MFTLFLSVGPMMLLHSGFPYRRQTDLLALSLTGIGSAWMLGLLLAEHCVSLSSLTGKFDQCLVRLKGCRGHVLLIGLLMILGQLEFTKEFGKFFFLMPLIVPLHGYSNSRLKSRVAQSYHTSKHMQRLVFMHWDIIDPFSRGQQKMSHT